LKYRHTITGVIIDIESEIKGAWEPVDQVPAPAPSTEKPKKAPAQTKKGAKK